MAAMAERGLEAAASIAGTKAMDNARHGRFRKALLWSIPLALAGAVFWYMRYRERLVDWTR
jgi:hypothetical protein